MGALARLGAVQCPLIPILRRAEVGFIAEQTACSLLVVPRTWRGHDHASMAHEIAARTGAQVLVVDLAARVGEALALPQADPSELPLPDQPDSERSPVRWLYYTSGTTSKPKGARHTDRSVMAGAPAMLANLGFSAGDVYPIAYPFTHIGAAAMLTSSLVTGLRLVLCEQFDAERTPLFMAEAGATLLGSAVPFFHAYLDAQRGHGSAPLFPKLRCCISGGAPKPPALHRELRRELGGVGIVSGYGLTEFPLASCGSLDDTDEHLALSEGFAGPDVELRQRGPQQCRGYVDASLDAEAFDEQGYLRTGDLGVLELSGHARITGSLKDLIIRNAENISAAEIEDVLYAHPKIADIAVIGLPDARTGERACAVVVLAEGVDSLALAELVEFGRVEGLAIQKLPEQLEIVDRLPRNAMGKILKQQLRETYRK